MPSTDAADDYLKAIWQHTEWQNERITPSQLAAQLGLAPSSVTEMVRKLAGLGLVSHERYGPISLTPAGLRHAAGVVRRHRLIETWLVREFGYGWDEVHDEAQVLEHTISDRLLDGIDKRLGRPQFDPHGDAIPDASGHVERVAFVLLDQAPAGHRGNVLRVSDRDPALLRAVETLGLTVGASVVVGVEGSVTVGEPGGPAVELPSGAAEAIWLTA